MADVIAAMIAGGMIWFGSLVEWGCEEQGHGIQECGVHWR